MKPVLFLLLLSAAILHAQSAPTDPVKIYTTAPGLNAPELLPRTASVSYVNDHCTGNQEGVATFSVIIDADGVPRNIYFLNPIGNDLDGFALKHVIEDRFRPGLLNGQPVAVAASMELSLRTCLRDEKDAQGKSAIVLHLAAAPGQKIAAAVDPPQQVILVSGTGLSKSPSDPEIGVFKVGGDVKPPIPFTSSNAWFSLERQLLGRGDYKVSILVDRYGMPASLRVLDSESGREKQLAAVVRLKRFKPALLKGEPVPVRFTLAIHNH